jgi:hypothetical protein
MSFSMTTEAVRNRTKTVTRRLGWDSIKPGDVLCAVKKGMGLKKGEKVERLALIRVVSTRWEPLYAVLYCDEEEMRREGFPGMSVYEFMDMFCRANRCNQYRLVNRIEFEYVQDDPETDRGATGACATMKSVPASATSGDMANT